MGAGRSGLVPALHLGSSQVDRMSKFLYRFGWQWFASQRRGQGRGTWKTVWFKLFPASLQPELHITHAPLVARLVAPGSAQKGLCRIKQPVKLLISCRGVPRPPAPGPCCFSGGSSAPHRPRNQLQPFYKLVPALPYFEPADTLFFWPGKHRRGCGAGVTHRCHPPNRGRRKGL